MISQVNMGLIGAGNRGAGVFGQYALDMPHRVKFTMVMEPEPTRREHFAQLHQIPADRCFSSLEEMKQAADRLKDIQAVAIGSTEDFRYEPIAFAMEQNWHILTEKPLCTNAAELAKLRKLCTGYPQIIVVCHQLRLTPVIRAIKSLLDSGRFGRITCLQHSENLAYSHMAHSFVRGIFSKDTLTPMLLQKSCHDMDVLLHLNGKKAKRVFSFGSRNFFRAENCPPGAPKFCLEGCPHASDCPFDVIKLYFSEDTDPAYLRQMGVIENREQLREYLCHSRYGRCVFQCDNNVVDNQVVVVEYTDGTTSSFTMCGTNAFERRIIKISLTNGEIVYDGKEENIVRASTFAPRRDETVEVKINGTHSGGDRAIMDNFVDAVSTGNRSGLLTPIDDSYAGHFLVFAAEESRKTGVAVDLDEYESRFE